MSGDTAQLDVAVVGAGLSGLVAARRLGQAGVGSVAVFEAKDRVGGRTLSASAAGGVPVDAGGQWIGPGQDRVAALARELGVAAFPTFDRGRGVLVLGGRRLVYRSPLPLRPAGFAANLVAVALRLQLAALRVDPSRPWTAREAARLDRTTFDRWLAICCRAPGVRTAMEIASALALGGDPRYLSLLGVLQHVRADGGLLRLLSVRGGAQELRFQGGAQSLSLRLADLLGRRVRLSDPVRRIGRTGDGVTVETAAGTFAARRAIVALSPADRRAIGFDPGPPPAAAGAECAAKMMTGIKVHAVYRRPFWRERGLSGQALGDRGPAPIAFDSSPPDGRAGVLTSFVAGERTGSAAGPSQRQLDDPGSRRDAVLGCLAAYFGEEARAPVDYLEQDWRSEPHTEGCIPTVGPGYWTEIAPGLADRSGPLIWAGSEQSRIWNGYMDGAVRAGESAARSAVADLAS